MHDSVQLIVLAQNNLLEFVDFLNFIGVYSM